MAIFRAPDGTEFSDRAEYRKYVFLTQYTFKDRQGEVLMKLPGDIDGQPFDLTTLCECEVHLLDHSEAIHADELTNCKVFIAACAESLFMRNCAGCYFTVACKQLRTRDCVDCEFRLYCKTEPIIETSTRLTFAPFNGAYAGHADHLQTAGLTTPNLWFGVYDFNDESRTCTNWRLLDPEEEGEPWRPLHDASEVAIPRTLPGSIPLPSGKQTGSGYGIGVGGGGGVGESTIGGGGQGSTTMAFSFSPDASKAATRTKSHHVSGGHSAENASTYPAVEEKEAAARRHQGGSQPSDDTESVAVVFPGDGAKIRWDPSRLGETFSSFASPGPSSAAAASSATIPSPSSQETELTKRDGEWTGSRSSREGNISPCLHFSEEAKSVGFHEDSGTAVDGKEGTVAEAGAALTPPGELLTEENYHDGRTTAESGGRNGDSIFGPPPATPLMQPVLASRVCLNASQRSRVGWDPARASFQAQAPQVRTPRAVQDSHTLDCDVAVTTPRAGDASTSPPPLPEITAEVPMIAASSAKRGLVAPARRKKATGCSAARIEDKAKTVPAPLQWEALEDEEVAVPVERGYFGECATGNEVWGGKGGESRSGWTRRVRGTPEKGVPQALLSLRAALLYASEQRGIDLAKWFLLDGGGERDGDGGTQAEPTSLTMVQFELVLVGLMEGLKVGLTNEARLEIDSAVTPEAIKVVAGTVAAEDLSDASSGEGGGRVNVCRLLDLCGIPSSWRKEARGNDGTKGVAGGIPEWRCEMAVGEGARECERVREFGRGRGCGRGFQEKKTWQRAEGTVAEDEGRLRRIVRQPDLYERLLTALGLRQPVRRPNPDGNAHAPARIASFKTGGATVKNFREALRAVGLPLSRARAKALAIHCCGGTLVTALLTRLRCKRRWYRARHSEIDIDMGTRIDSDTDHASAVDGGNDEWLVGDKSRALLPAKPLRDYLQKLSNMPRSKEEGHNIRRRRFAYRDWGGATADHEDQEDENHKGIGSFNSNEQEGEVEGGVRRDGRGGVAVIARSSVLSGWSRRQAGRQPGRERQKEREFQKALDGQAFSLKSHELEDCVRRLGIMPQEMLIRELQVMATAFLESVEGARKTRELIRHWGVKSSPVARGACGPDDAEQTAWERARKLGKAQRRSMARAMVAREREKELKQSEETSASVSRGLFLAYISRRRRGMSLRCWLENRHAAMKKARYLEAGRERARALSKADNLGRQALITDVKEELERLVGVTKKPQKVARAPGMEVLRSSRTGLDLNRRFKLLEKAAREERRGRAAGRSRPTGSRQRRLDTPRGERNQRTLDLEQGEQALLSKEAFMAEMSDVLFSLTADVAAASRAKQLAGVSLVAPSLRRRWAKEAWGSGGDDVAMRTGGVLSATAHDNKCDHGRSDDRGLKLPFADDLFTVGKALLRGRGRRKAEHKRELATRKYNEWYKQKRNEARHVKKQQRQNQEDEAEREQRRKENGLKAYRRWVRLARGGKYFSNQSNSVASRAGLSPRVGINSVSFKAAGSVINEENEKKSEIDGDRGGGGAVDIVQAGRCKGGEGASVSPERKGSRRRGKWNSSTNEAEKLLGAGVEGHFSGFPDFL